MGLREIYMRHIVKLSLAYDEREHIYICSISESSLVRILFDLKTILKFPLFALDLYKHILLTTIKEIQLINGITTQSQSYRHKNMIISMLFNV